MADFGRLRRGLGAPPPMEEASPNLQAPEVAPAEPVQAAPAPALPAPVEQPPAVPVIPAPAPTPMPAPATPAPAEQPRARRDGRTMRKTNRTVAFATRVSEAWDNRIRDIAERDKLMLVEVLERALEAYENAKEK